MKLEDAAKLVDEFHAEGLTSLIARLEHKFVGADKNAALHTCSSERVTSSVLHAAKALKQAAGQVNVIVHAVGILLALPRILDAGEVVETLSLGAGNTGRLFDLVTNLRIAEFKFIDWRGGSESIRQNALFKDFFNLAEAKTDKAKYLYVLGLVHPLNFLNGNRALDSIMSRNQRLKARFHEIYQDRFTVVSEYYSHRRASVQLVDLAPTMPALSAVYESSPDNDLN